MKVERDEMTGEGGYSMLVERRGTNEVEAAETDDDGIELRVSVGEGGAA